MCIYLNLMILIKIIRGFIRTPRILPGVTAIGQGAWLKADMFGDRVDHGGSINILTSHRPSPLAKGNPSHSNLVQIEKV